MSECEELRHRLVAWMDAELSDDDTESIRQHVARCKLCAGVVEKYEAIRQAASAWQEPQETGEETLIASSGLWEGIQNQIQIEEWATLRMELEQTRQMVRDLQAEVGVLRHRLNQQQKPSMKLPGVLLPYGVSETQSARHRPLL